MRELLFSMLVIFFIASPSSWARPMPEPKGRFSVLKYGAVGDGRTDDSKAFMEAWADVCKASQGVATLDVPKGFHFLLKPVTFNGPCASKQVRVQLEGTLVREEVAPNGEAWIRFGYIDGLSIGGGGQIDGQGSAWWKACLQNSGSSNCNSRPIAVHISSCKGLQLSELMLVNSSRSHLTIYNCQGVEISGLHINAPADSPNTDGINIALSTNVKVSNSVIATGDDCIAISNGSSVIDISGISCGPGHGISIGSLGGNGGYDKVEEVNVRNCNFTGTQNGARIKTWKGGSGYCKKILFEHIQVKDCDNPIIIDQNYNPHGESMMAEKDDVMVSDVTFRDVRGTSSGDFAIDLNCSKMKGCNGISLEQIDITSSTPGKQARSLCNNARILSNLVSPEVSCPNQ